LLIDDGFEDLDEVSRHWSIDQGRPGERTITSGRAENNSYLILSSDGSDATKASSQTGSCHWRVFMGNESGCLPESAHRRHLMGQAAVDHPGASARNHSGRPGIHQERCV